MSKRLIYIDNVAGVMICYMMLMHILLWKKIPLDGNSILLEPLKFFMFWFFFKSGMFFSLKATKVKVLGGGKRLLVPFVVFSIAGYVLHSISLLLQGDENWMHYVLTPIKELVLGGSVGGNDVLWFLTTLFFVQIVYNELIMRRAKSCVVVVAALFVACLLNRYSVGKPAYLANGALGLACYAFGDIMRTRQYSKAVFGVCFLVWLSVMLFAPSHIDLRTNCLSEGGNYLCALAFSLSGCIVVNNVFRHLRDIPLLGYVGRDSMPFYVMHMLFLQMLMLAPLSRWGMPDSCVFLLMCLSALALPAVSMMVLRKFGLCWMLGESR